MVVGGRGPGDRDVEIIDLDGTSSNCSKPMDHPLGWPMRGLFINGIALVCGGQSTDCYTYDSNQGKSTEAVSQFLD